MSVIRWKSDLIAFDAASDYSWGDWIGDIGPPPLLCLPQVA